MFGDFLKRPLEAERLSVRAISCHRVNRIRNHNYACANRYALAGQAIGIASAIIILMMVTNVHLHPSSEFRNRSGEVGATNRMSLHQHTLFRREPTCFTKKWRKVLVNFADVMQKSRRSYLVNMLWV